MPIALAIRPIVLATVALFPSPIALPALNPLPVTETWLPRPKALATLNLF
jgi:hypothetical protein